MLYAVTASSFPIPITTLSLGFVLLVTRAWAETTMEEATKRASTPFYGVETRAPLPFTVILK